MLFKSRKNKSNRKGSAIAQRNLRKTVRRTSIGVQRQKRQSILLEKRQGLSFPKCTTLSQFKISDENIAGFKRFVDKPMDCVINALQIFGALDSKSSNILRISCAGDEGIYIEQIEKIFTLLLGNNFDFQSSDNYQDFVEIIEKTLLPGYGVFAGYTGHVFIIARKENGVIMLIDPQRSQIVCEINKCQDYIRNYKEYYLLFQSPEKLTPSQISSMGFYLHP